MSGSRVPNSKIDWRYVGWQVLVWSAVAWAVALLLALFLMGSKGFAKGLQIGCALSGAVVLVAGVLGIAGGPIMRGGSRLAYRPPTKKTTVGDTSPNGLAGMGIALVVAPQLFFVGLVVLGRA